MTERTFGPEFTFKIVYNIKDWDYLLVRGRWLVLRIKTTRQQNAAESFKAVILLFILWLFGQDVVSGMNRGNSVQKLVFQTITWSEKRKSRV